MFAGRLTNDFHTNKRIIDDIAIIQSKRLRNKIAGFTTHMMKRIQKGPVKGISLKLQEEVCSKHLVNLLSRKERERWTSFPRDQSCKWRTSSLRTTSSDKWSRTSDSESSSPARSNKENDHTLNTLINRETRGISPFLLNSSKIYINLFSIF